HGFLLDAFLPAGDKPSPLLADELRPSIPYPLGKLPAPFLRPADPSLPHPLRPSTSDRRTAHHRQFPERRIAPACHLGAPGSSGKPPHAPLRSRRLGERRDCAPEAGRSNWTAWVRSSSPGPPAPD